MSSIPALSNVRVVLVETSHPGNLGAVARAMKVMGLSRLCLVSPKCAIDDEARARASGAVDVLEAAVVCTSLDEALAGTVLAAATTSRRRDLPHPAYTPRQAAPLLLAEAQAAPVALVFGSETFGLSNEQLSRCRWLINIPANPDYMSLNLGSAVQVLAYELRASLEDATIPLPENAVSAQANLRAAKVKRSGRSQFEPARHEEVEGFYAELEKTLVAIGFLDPAAPKRLMPRLRRLFARAGLEKEEVAILRGVLAAVQKLARQ